MSPPTPTSPLFKPQLRWPLDIQLHLDSGKEFIVIRCPQGMTDKPLALVRGIAPILSLFTGERTIAEIADKFSAQGATQDIVMELARLLDDHLFLAGASFDAHIQGLRATFAAQPVRQAQLPGICYADSDIELRRELQQYVASAQGLPSPYQSKDLRCLVAPHIDYRRGQRTYGAAFSNLAGAGYDTLIVIGTSHQYSEHLFHFTAKDFDSPLGLIRCNHSFVNKLATRYGPVRSYADELLHRREHSLELQIPFLAYQTPHVKIVPILVGSFQSFVAGQVLPSQSEPYECFVQSLVETIREAEQAGEHVGILCGVDMAHCGARFGDTATLTPDKLATIRERDLIYIDRILQGDHHGLLEHIAEDGDRRRICGFPTMYTILDTLKRLGGPVKGHLYEYRQAVDYTTDCAVTFAALGLYNSA